MSRCLSSAGSALDAMMHVCALMLGSLIDDGIELVLCGNAPMLGREGDGGGGTWR